MRRHRDTRRSHWTAGAAPVATVVDGQYGQAAATHVHDHVEPHGEIAAVAVEEHDLGPGLRIGSHQACKVSPSSVGTRTSTKGSPASAEFPERTNRIERDMGLEPPHQQFQGYEAASDGHERRRIGTEEQAYCGTVRRRTATR